jgi:alkylation response protein AidB-like acyl-CoA dehydrogenase
LRTANGGSHAWRSTPRASVVQPFLAEALAYAAGRKIPDVAIETHQQVQRRLVDIRMRSQRSRWMALGALERWLSDDPASTPADMSADTHAAKPTRGPAYMQAADRNHIDRPLLATECAVAHSSILGDDET